MKKILVFLKSYIFESIMAPLFKMLEATFELFVPLVVAAIIDTGIGNKDMPYIGKMGAILVALSVIGLVCSITAQFFAAKAATGFSTKLRHALFAHIESFSFTEIDKIGTSTLITRMTSDVNQVQSGVNLVLRLFLRSPFIVFGAMIMAFTIDVESAMIFVVTIPLLSIVVFGVMLISIPLFKRVQAGVDKILGITRENLTGARVIRAFNKEESEVLSFVENNDTLTKMQLFVGKFSALMNPVTYIIINGAIIAIVWQGGLKVDSGVLTQGQVIALISYMSQILVELVKLANLIITVTKAVACGNRIASVLEMETSMVDGDATREGMENKSETAQNIHKNCADTVGVNNDYLVFDHVGLRYQEAAEESLTDMNLRVKKGQTIGVIGGTGSGKSSFVHLIPRFYDATSGSVMIDGKDVKDYSLEELRDKIGMVMQKAVLFKGTIRENIRWGKNDATDEEIYEALSIAQAKEFVDKKEGKLDEMISEGGKNLSGGQRQRLTIARALVKKPDILIMDDSASALDFATDAKLRQAINKMEGDMTVFIVSQRASSIMHADQIVVLDDGKIVGLGTHDELLSSCEVYQEIYESQFKKEDR